MGTKKIVGRQAEENHHEDRYGNKKGKLGHEELPISQTLQHTCHTRL
jgi:hypothetical protein